MAKDSNALIEEGSVTRRRFMNFVGWGSFVSFFGGITLGTLRFFFPRVLYEPLQQFTARQTGRLSGWRGKYPYVERASGMDDPQQ